MLYISGVCHFDDGHFLDSVFVREE